MTSTSSAPSPLHTRPPVVIRTDQPQGGMLGLLPELGQDALGLFARCGRDYGDFVRMRFGLMHTVLIGHPDLVEEVLVTRNHDFRKNLGTRRLRAALGNGLLVSEGDFWLQQRRLMQPGFHRQRIVGMAGAMVCIVSKAVASWQAGDKREIYQEMRELTLQIAARTLFGADITERDLTRIRRSSMIMTAHLRSRLFSLMMLLPDSAPTPGNLRYAAAIRH